LKTLVFKREAKKMDESENKSQVSSTSKVLLHLKKDINLVKCRLK